MTAKTARRRLAALLLFSPLVPSAVAETYRHAPFLNRYEPSTNVDDVAALDLDQRSIVARLASGTYAGLREAEEIYSKGRVSNSATLPDEDRVTLQGLGTMFVAGGNTTSAESIMGVASTTYERFVEYYGSEDYADEWTQAAFDGIATGFEEGDADFSKLDLEGRSEAIRYGTVALNLWINVVGRIESAADLCANDSGEDNFQVAEWDRAVALYTGSLAREDGENGHFLYTLAQAECAKFGTCEEGDVAPVNDRIFSEFRDGKERLQQGNCRNVAADAERIRNLMTVPLVQGLLRATYALDAEDDYRTATQGEGAAFAASILPLLDKCNSGNADAVREDLTPGKATGSSFQVVKAALERSYECLGITCADVGGIVNLRGDGYLAGAEACGYVRPAGSDAEDGSRPEKEDPTEKEDDDDHLLRYENDYFMGEKPHSSHSDTGGFLGMDAKTAFWMSGLIFGFVGLVLGAGIVAACKNSGIMTNKEAEVEFVASSNANVGDEENEVI